MRETIKILRQLKKKSVLYEETMFTKTIEEMSKALFSLGCKVKITKCKAEPMSGTKGIIKIYCLDACPPLEK